MKVARSVPVRIFRWLFSRKHHLLASKPDHVPLSAWRRMRISRHSLGCGVGVLIMLSGSCLAQHSHEVSNSVVVLDTITIDAFGYFMHALGCLPIVAHIEPLIQAWLEG